MKASDSMTRLVVIIQCQLAQNRCSGFACSHSFYEKAGKFEGYDGDTRYIPFSCGGCCGKGVAVKMEHLCKKLRTKTDIKPSEVTVHLSSCMVMDNHHYDRCPHIEYIKKILSKKGFTNVVEGSYVSRNATLHREKGTYIDYEACPEMSGD